MSSNSINKGGEASNFGYRQEARSELFNQMFCEIVPYGIYKGGELRKTSPTSVSIAPVICIIRSNENDSIALRKETTKDYTLELNYGNESHIADPEKCYIVLRFGWRNEDGNFMDILSVKWSEFDQEDENYLKSTDIILGKVRFVENGSGHYVIAEERIFDFTRRHDVFVKKAENVSSQFRVSANEPSSNKIYVSGGVVHTSRGRKSVEGKKLTVASTGNDGGRTDLVVLNANYEFKIIKGVPSQITEIPKESPGIFDPAPAPKYLTYKVLAEIRRRANRTDVVGADIYQVTDSTVLGQVLAEDFPLEDKENMLPEGLKNVEAAINFFMHRSNTLTADEALLNNHINSVMDDTHSVHGIYVCDDMDYPL